MKDKLRLLEHYIDDLVIDKFVNEPKLMAYTHLANSSVILIVVCCLYVNTPQNIHSWKALFNVRVSSEFGYIMKNIVYIPMTNVFAIILILLGCIIFSVFIYKWTVLSLLDMTTNFVFDGCDKLNIVYVGLIILLGFINIFLLYIIFKWLAIFVALLIACAVCVGLKKSAALQD